MTNAVRGTVNAQHFQCWWLWCSFEFSVMRCKPLKRALFIMCFSIL
ncbi:acetyltransferase [Vibrio anguillarum]|nr:acetyltransferase [Vibrio anguillarum]NNN97506.1 acetyltransferase [Vibrio sp. B4-6]